MFCRIRPLQDIDKIGKPYLKALNDLQTIEYASEPTLKTFKYNVISPAETSKEVKSRIVFKYWEKLLNLLFNKKKVSVAQNFIICFFLLYFSLWKIKQFGF
jgi:hypothetical protein